MKTLQHLCDQIEASSIWKPTSVTQEPHTKLTSWRVFSVIAPFSGDHDTTIHFVGYAWYEGRVSSPVLEYDASTKRGVTSSGRIYELDGNSGHNSDALYVWERWCDNVHPTVVKDITSQYE